ncbi:MAG: hypothetical protein MJ132_07485, partial [Clostridia bacterium]|nr:hypothetical protein [Clostridia bacterium]
FSGCKKSNDEGTWTEEEVIVSTDGGEAGTQTDAVSDGDKTTDGNKKGNTTSSKKTGTGNSTDTRQDLSATGGQTVGQNTKIDNPYKADLGGATIKIYTTTNDFTKSDASASKSSAAMLKMAQTLEKQLNCKIKVETYNYTQLQKLTMMGMASNEYFADIIITPIYTSVGYLTSKYVYDMSKISTMDLSQSYMNVGNGVNSYHLGSGYWAVGEPTYIASTGSPVLYNKRILKELGYEEDYIYDLVKKGKWNLSAFRNLAKKAVKEMDGKPGITTADRLGIVQIDIGTSAFSNVLQTMGAEMITNKNGVLTYNMTDPKILNSLELANNIFVKDGTCKEASDLDGTAQNLFMSGHSLFLSGGYFELLKKISGMDDDYGLVPFPAADGSNKYSVPVNWNNCCMMIPGNLNEKQAKNAGAFIQAYCYASQTVVDAMYDEYSSRYLCDAESKENLYRCYNAETITVASILGGAQGALHNGTYKVLYEASHGQSPNSLIQGTANATKTIVNDFYKKLK